MRQEQKHQNPTIESESVFKGQVTSAPGKTAASEPQKFTVSCPQTPTILVDCAVWAPLEITVQGFDLKAATLEKMLGFVPKQISLPDWMDYLFSAPISVSNV
jgi:hypothetical protein